MKRLLAALRDWLAAGYKLAAHGNTRPGGALGPGPSISVDDA
jgi:hypothetical protein